MKRLGIGFAMTALMTATLTVLLIGCSGSVSTDPSSSGVSDSEELAVESGLSTVTSEATATEGGSISGGSGCTYASRTSCTSGSDSVTFLCNADANALTLRGTWNEVFSGSGTLCTVPVTSGQNLTRKTTNLTATLNYTAALGLRIKTDTNGGTTYDGTTLTNAGLLTSAADTTVGATTVLQRTFTISGLHKLGIYRGQTLFDHLITTVGVTAPTMTGNSRATRVLSGQVLVYHNIAQYKVLSTFNSVTWADSSCCYPTSGTMTSAFNYQSGATATSTLTFSASCGIATFLSTTTGVTKSVSLTSCN